MGIRYYPHSVLRQSTGHNRSDRLDEVCEAGGGRVGAFVSESRRFTAAKALIVD